jgi:hypothetical protein
VDDDGSSSWTTTARVRASTVTGVLFTFVLTTRYLVVGVCSRQSPAVLHGVLCVSIDGSRARPDARDDAQATPTD